MVEDKFPKTTILPDELIKRTSYMLEKIASKTVYKDEEVINTRKRIKTLSEVKEFENKSKNPQSFLEISPDQKEVFLHINCKTIFILSQLLLNSFPTTDSNYR